MVQQRFFPVLVSRLPHFEVEFANRPEIQIYAAFPAAAHFFTTAYVAAGRQVKKTCRRFSISATRAACASIRQW